MSKKTITAAVIIIGNEILSGRTNDVNINYIAKKLNEYGIRLMECRIIADQEDEIVNNVNELRVKFDYIFTTGGIGPTHDDITALAIAKAFSKKLVSNPQAYDIMAAYYKAKNIEFTKTRARMTYMPEGGVLIENKISAAPGFNLENVFVMAGVPKIMCAMFDSILPNLQSGIKIISKTLLCNLPEGTIANGLSHIQDQSPNVEIGSYPSFNNDEFSLSLVLHATDIAELTSAHKKLIALISKLNGKIIAAADI